MSARVSSVTRAGFFFESRRVRVTATNLGRAGGLASRTRIRIRHRPSGRRGCRAGLVGVALTLTTAFTLFYKSQKLYTLNYAE